MRITQALSFLWAVRDMKQKLFSHKQTKVIREWAEAYRLWNKQELARRRTKAGQDSVEEKLAAFFGLCESMFQIAPPKSAALYQAQLQAHADERQRMLRFAERRLMQFAEILERPDWLARYESLVRQL